MLKAVIMLLPIKPWILLLNLLNLFMTVVHFVQKLESVVEFNAMKQCYLLRRPCKKTASVMNTVM